GFGRDERLHPAQSGGANVAPGAEPVDTVGLVAVGRDDLTTGGPGREVQRDAAAAGERRDGTVAVERQRRPVEVREGLVVLAGPQVAAVQVRGAGRGTGCGRDRGHERRLAAARVRVDRGGRRPRAQRAGGGAVPRRRGGAGRAGGPVQVVVDGARAEQRRRFGGRRTQPRV